MRRLAFFLAILLLTACTVPTSPPPRADTLTQGTQHHHLPEPQ